MKNSPMSKLVVLSVLQLLFACLFQGAAFAANSVTIKSTTCGTFSTSPASPISVAKNATASFTFTPGSGYTYSSVSMDVGVATASGATITLDTQNGADNTAYTATVVCTAITKTVTLTPGTGGTIASSGNGGSNTWVQNTTATYVITPAAGYVLDSYTIDSTTTTPTATVYDNAHPLTVTFPIGTTNHAITTVFVNTRPVAVVQTGNPTGTVTSCDTAGIINWPASGIAKYSIAPTVGANSSLIETITIAPTSPYTGSTQTITVANGGTGYTCGSPLTFNMNGLKQTLTITYKAGAAVTKTVRTNGVAGSSGGTVTSCGYGDNWEPTATASYSILPNSGYVVSNAIVSPATVTKTPAGSIWSGGYLCSNFTFPIGAQAQSLTVDFTTSVPVAVSIKKAGTAYAVTCPGGACTATDSLGYTIATITGCNGSNAWGQNLNASYMIIPGSGFKLTSVVGGSTSNSAPPAGGYTSCAAPFTFGVGAAGTTLTADFASTAVASISGQVVNSAGVSGGDILVGGTSIVSVPYSSTPSSPVTASFTIPAGAGIKSLSWTPSGGSLVDVTAMLTCASLTPADFTSNTCQFTIPGVSGTTPTGTAFTGVGLSGGTLKVTYDLAYSVTATAVTSGCGGTNGGLVNGAGTTTYKVVNGSFITIAGTAASGYAIKDVTDITGSSIGVPTTTLGTSYSRAFGPITSSGKTVSFIFTPVFTVNSNPPVSFPLGSTATGTLTPASQLVMCGAAIQLVTIAPTPPASIMGVSIASPDGTTAALGNVASLSSAISQFASVDKPWTITATFFQPVPVTGNDYAITPPFVQAAILPNLLLMIDNSSSQYDLQYDSTGQCYDSNAYLNTTTYSGYFNGTDLYSYSAVNNRFESGATLPASCTYRTPYFCVAMSGTKPNRTVSNFVASGNFLNYLAMSKLDIQKLILTGGKYDASAGNLVAESRGCNGKRFAKIISNLQASGSTESLTGLTFVVRGPNASDGANYNPAVEAGTTRIDLFDYSYSAQIATCQAAFNDWMPGSTANQGTTQGDTDACISSSVTDPKFTRVLQMIHSCYYTQVKGNDAPPSGQLKNTADSCKDEYLGNGVTATAPSAITNNQAGDAVCSSVLNHTPINGRDVGFLGVCWNSGTSSFTSDACLIDQINDFCGLMGGGQQVTDPTGSGDNTNSFASSMPGFFMDAGINSLGKPANASPYLANVKKDPPAGLINEFKEYINFGTMVFNADGAKTECVSVGSTTVLGSNQIACARHCSNNTSKGCYFNSDCTPGICQDNTNRDGGKITSYIANNSGVGNHSSGLINAIDNITAASWTPFAETFYNAIGYFAADTNLRLDPADWDSTNTPPAEPCRRNNILIISDGASTADQNATVATLAGKYNDGTAEGYGACTRYSGSKNLSAMAWMAQNKNIRTLSSTTAQNHTLNNQFITTYVTYSGPDQLAANACDPYYLMNKTAVNGGTTMYRATTYAAMLQALRDAFQKIASASASGTAASILNNSEGSGANLLQAVFFPKKIFEKDANNIDTVANWLGELQNLWYFVDPFFNRSTIREDTNQNYILDMASDFRATFRFDAATNQTLVDLDRDTSGTGASYTSVSAGINPDDVKSIWKAGKLLWGRNVNVADNVSTARKIYTVTGTAAGSPLRLFSFNSTAFTQDNAAVWPLLQTADAAETVSLTKYIHGIDFPGNAAWRNRTVRIGGQYNPWKLGDIVDSTPKILSGQPMSNYALPPPNGYYDSSYSLFSNSDNYRNRGMVFVGANDGMMHAFRMGILDVSAQTATAKGRLLDYSRNLATASSGLGEEVWSFIPRNVLPYLKYYGQPEYAHLFYVDNSPAFIDASLERAGCTEANYWDCPRKVTYSSGKTLDMANTSWRSILIGGMGLGGASRNRFDSGGSEISCASCVKTPLNGIGYSSYFALDVTNPEQLPGTSSTGEVKFLWEFNAGGQLGYSTSGPAVVRIGDRTKNGRWLAVFASGPTGPINTTTHAFLGQSDQPLKLFVVDIATGTLIKTITNFGINNAGASLPDNAYAGSIASAVIDTDRWNQASPGNYSDDAVYVGYVQKDVADWTKGGVIRILTRESTDPAQWEVSSVISGIGPVTTAVTKLQDRAGVNGSGSATSATGKLWLFFGSGRFYNKDDTPADHQRLYGLVEPCYSRNSGPPDFTPTGPTNDFSNTASCTDSVAVSELQNQSGTAAAAPAQTLANESKGWYIDLIDQAVNDGYNSERVITNPVATPSGAVFFTTFRPSTDICSFLGNSYIWGVKYNTGGNPPAAAMNGRALLQVSTGAIAEIALSGRFRNADQRYDNRRIDSPIVGMPPTAGGLALMTSPPPTKKILHMQEK